MQATRFLILALAPIVVVMAVADPANGPAPLGTTFTYQGRLTDGDVPANGEYDFEFGLYDSLGAQVGSPIRMDEHPVTNGLFTVVLNAGDEFGPDAFNGEARWLDIGVRPGASSDPDPYTYLSPRQELTPAPHALYAEVAGYAEVSGGATPAGGIIMWSGALADIPAGWALCDGTNGTPDLKDRFVLGAAAGEDPGATGGNHTYALSVNQLPSHNHSFTTYSAGDHSHGAGCSSGGNHRHSIGGGSAYLVTYDYDDGHGDYNGSPPWLVYIQPYTDYAGSHAHTISIYSGGNHNHSGTTNATGGNEPVDNRPAYYKLAFIMKL